MPSQLHEALLELFRNRPRLAAELLELALHVQLPEFSEVQIASADFNDVKPAEYRADAVVLLMHGQPVFGIVVEVQLAPNPRKRLVWPVYSTELRARRRCQTCVLVLCADDGVAQWAAQPIDLGGGNLYRPLVLGPSGVPEVTDPETAQRDPELAVLSAMAHGGDPDPTKAVAIAALALTVAARLDDPKALLYADMVQAALGDAARKALQDMDPAKYQFQSEFAKRYISEGKAEGRAEGKAEGRAETLLKQLSLKFGPLGDEVIERIRSASLEELDRYVERVLSATTLDEVFG